MTAIALLIFNDTILGLVASVQMWFNDMVRVGDRVEMRKDLKKYHLLKEEKSNLSTGLLYKKKKP
ncbi:Mechanosensitive ion channel [Fodinibius roseus]|uniref:Mechanosensitive ion channel n=1 Tax=Fodinibius roseus TaxID=1194090 RepID=A0A1M4WHM9_9BACT|nr:mechanosensitive ion channel [Fodinibius roseus]SHE80748.1 Mechanosensitive ion channel [Fodinibius roseus]